VINDFDSYNEKANKISSKFTQINEIHEKENEKIINEMIIFRKNTSEDKINEIKKEEENLISIKRFKDRVINIY